MTHGHPDDYPDRGSEPSRRPTPRLNRLINATFGTTANLPDNPGPQVVATHRRAREVVSEAALLTVHPDPRVAQAALDISRKSMHTFISTSDMINKSVANRGNVRRDLANMANEVNADDIAEKDKKRASEDTYRPDEG